MLTLKWPLFTPWPVVCLCLLVFASTAMALVNTCVYDGCCKKFVMPWTIFEVRVNKTIHQFFTQTSAKKELHVDLHHLDKVRVGQHGFSIRLG